jgi:hypothetical protein
MKRIEFIAALFCLALAGLMVGGMNLYEVLEFRYFGKQAQMELADPAKKRAIPAGDQSVYLMDVRYVGSGEPIIVPGKKLWGDAARAVSGGGRVPVTYLKHTPQRVLYQNEELDSPWGWLVAGLLSLGAFIYALVLRRRDARRAADR